MIDLQIGEKPLVVGAEMLQTFLRLIQTHDSLSKSVGDCVLASWLEETQQAYSMCVHFQGSGSFLQVSIFSLFFFGGSDVYWYISRHILLVVLFTRDG